MPIWLIQLVVGVALSVVSTLMQQATAKRPEPSGYRGSAQVGGKVPQSAVLGTIALPGKLAYVNTWGSSGDVQNAHLTKVLSFGVLPISGCTGLYINGQRVTKASTGHVAQGYPIAQYGGKLWWEFFAGSQTSANSFLRSAFGADADRPWTSGMIGRGVPYLTLDALYDPKVFSGEPALMAELQGIPLYDPREDSTAGGSGSQRLADQSTWTFSDNVAVLIYNVLVGLRYDNSVVWGGRATEAQLPYATWAAAMDACDVAVDLAAGGTEKQFRAGLEVSFDRTPTDVIRDLLVACNGRISEVAGNYYILVGAPGAADGSFTDADIIITEGASLAPFPGLGDIINGATATYLEPEQAWESKETAPYYRSDLELQDDGRRQAEGLDLACVFSGTQAQRILKAVVEEARRFRKHVVVLPPQFAVYRPLQTLGWTSTANGYTAKLWLITARTVGPNGNVVLGLQEIDADDYAWSSSDEQPLSFAPLTPIRPPPQITTGFAVAPYSVLDADGLPKAPAIEVFWDVGLTDVRNVRIQVRQHWDLAIVADVTVDYDPEEVTPSRVVSSPSILAQMTYEVRGIYLPYSGRVTRWSNQGADGTDGAWLLVTTPAAASVDRQDLAAYLQAQIQYATDSINDLRDNLQAISGTLQDQDAANYDDKRQILVNLRVVVGEQIATLQQVVEVLATDTAAAAATATAAQATANAGTASGLLKMQVESNPVGVDAKITQYLSTEVGGSTTSSFETLEIASDGTSTKTFVCDIFQVLAGDASSGFIVDTRTGNISMGSLT